MVHIGFLTQSDRYDPIINDLAKAGIKAIKVDRHFDYSQLETILIDLNYPLEIAYTVLEKIDAEASLQSVNVIVIVNSAAEYKNLSRIQSLRISDYISSEITSTELLKRIRAIKEPDKEAKAQFNNTAIKVRTNGVLTHITESGILLLSPILMAKDIRIKLNSSLINDLTRDDKIILKVSKTISSIDKNFISEVDFLNISDKSRKSIRQTTMGWSVK